MITREEALKSEPLVTPNGYYNKVYKKSEYTAIINLIFDQQDQLQQHINSLEAQLANTEQLTCYECKHRDNDGFCNVVFNAQLFHDTDKTVAVYIEACDGFSCTYFQSKDTQ